MRTLALLAVLALPAAVAAQDPDTPTVPIDTVRVSPDAPLTPMPTQVEVEPPMSPRRAFITSMILPGWGQAAFDSHVRGGVFFAGWAGNWYMLFRTSARLEEARYRQDLRERQIRTSLIEGSENPDSMRMVLDTTDLLESVVEEDSTAVAMGRLVDAREQQREDWIAWSLFWILASGIDGYVTAHLWDFPVGIDIEPNLDRSVSLKIEVPLPRRRP